MKKLIIPSPVLDKLTYHITEHREWVAKRRHLLLGNDTPENIYQRMLLDCADSALLQSLQASNRLGIIPTKETLDRAETYAKVYTHFVETYAGVAHGQVYAVSLDFAGVIAVIRNIIENGIGVEA